MQSIRERLQGKEKEVGSANEPMGDLYICITNQNKTQASIQLTHTLSVLLNTEPEMLMSHMTRINHSWRQCRADMLLIITVQSIITTLQSNPVGFVRLQLIGQHSALQEDVTLCCRKN